MTQSDIQMLNATMLTLKSSVDELIQVLCPSLKLAPDTPGQVGQFDPDKAAGADELRLALRDSGLSTEQIENLVDTYILGKDQQDWLSRLP